MKPKIIEKTMENQGQLLKFALDQLIKRPSARAGPRLKRLKAMGMQRQAGRDLRLGLDS